MPSIEHIHAFDLPALQPYRTLRRPMDHFREGIFVAEGENVVRRLMSSGLTIISFLMTLEWFQKLFLHGEVPSAAGQESPTIYLAEKKLLETIVGYNLHQGIMALARVPQEQSLEETLNNCIKPHLLIALDGLVNAENVGVVVRNSAAFGADAILVGETSSSPYLRRAVRNSMGAIFHMPAVHLENLAMTLEELRKNWGTTIVAAHPHGSSPLETTTLTGNLCFVLGNEGYGISADVLRSSTLTVSIPMMNSTDSLNVASASAVFLYEARKQRRSP
jgi:tRNA G18 (ribose-2'-O)-methylase SpoU